MRADHDSNCPHCGGAPDPSTLPEQYVYSKLKTNMWRHMLGGLLLAIVTGVVLTIRYGSGAAVLATGIGFGSLMLGRWMAWGEQRASDLVSIILVKRPELMREMFGSDPEVMSFMVVTQCALIQARCEETKKSSGPHARPFTE